MFLSPGTRHPSFRASRPTVPSKFIHLRVHPGQHIRVVSLRRKLFDRTPITRAPIRGRPLKHAKVPVGRRRPARILVPRAAVRARPLQHAKARPPPLLSTLTYPKGSSLHAPTAAPRDARPTPPPSMRLRPTGSRQRATPATLRDVHPSPLPHKGILDATGDLPVAGAAPCLNIQRPRHYLHHVPQTEAPFLPPRHASRRSPLGAVRDRRDRRNTQI